MKTETSIHSGESSFQTTPLEKKSTLEEIRRRFDHDVERFSQLETGQQATIDAPLVLDLVADVAAAHLRPGAALLDLGCGAGNFTLRLLQAVSPLDCHLVDLSAPMLERAASRIRATGVESVTTVQTDLRTAGFPSESFDTIVAAAVLHHLRDDADWEAAFAELYRWLKPNGRLYVSDLMTFDRPCIQDVMARRYGDYLEALGGPEYRDKVFAYVDKEDSPRSLPYQIDLVRRTGFSSYDVLHRNSVFGCYVAVK